MRKPHLQSGEKGHQLGLSGFEYRNTAKESRVFQYSVFILFAVASVASDVKNCKGLKTAAWNSGIRLVQAIGSGSAAFFGPPMGAGEGESENDFGSFRIRT